MTLTFEDGIIIGFCFGVLLMAVLEAHYIATKKREEKERDW